MENQEKVLSPEMGAISALGAGAETGKQLHEKVRGIWMEKKTAKIAIVVNTRAKEVSVDATDEQLASIDFMYKPSQHNDYYEIVLVLPVPEEKLDKCLAEVEKFINSFFLGLEMEEGEYSFWDGVAVLNSFVDLCTKLYPPYLTRGIKAEIDDTGGDYPEYHVRAEWYG
ncbi:hypothetical protein [Candidatus Methanodesulfokora washburnensis]|uniref:Uncharacterized protein n=1 Tax=Candidatus Methanodesulfokora washburnensis TaxID=2478471 RepID=A0A429GSR6_9CREN|nr:hypothetical protein [Candidatus Methanodesulfokores washburnensis]RSN76880.1 hypothetical protein D6D85_03420 [Candidatus Methanodesulfokores washburnensis]